MLPVTRARLSSVCASSVLPVLVALRPTPSAVQWPRSSSAQAAGAHAASRSATPRRPILAAAGVDVHAAEVRNT